MVKGLSMSEEYALWLPLRWSFHIRNLTKLVKVPNTMMKPIECFVRLVEENQGKFYSCEYQHSDLVESKSPIRVVHKRRGKRTLVNYANAFKTMNESKSPFSYNPHFTLQIILQHTLIILHSYLSFSHSLVTNSLFTLYFHHYNWLFTFELTIYLLESAYTQQVQTLKMVVFKSACQEHMTKASADEKRGGTRNQLRFLDSKRNPFPF